MDFIQQSFGALLFYLDSEDMKNKINIEKWIKVYNSH